MILILIDSNFDFDFDVDVVCLCLWVTWLLTNETNQLSLNRRCNTKYFDRSYHEAFPINFPISRDKVRICDCIVAEITVWGTLSKITMLTQILRRKAECNIPRCQLESMSPTALRRLGIANSSYERSLECWTRSLLFKSGRLKSSTTRIRSPHYHQAHIYLCTVKFWHCESVLVQCWGSNWKIATAGLWALSLRPISCGQFQCNKARKSSSTSLSQVESKWTFSHQQRRLRNPQRVWSVRKKTLLSGTKSMTWSPSASNRLNRIIFSESSALVLRLRWEFF